MQKIRGVFSLWWAYICLRLLGVYDESLRFFIYGGLGKDNSPAFEWIHIHNLFPVSLSVLVGLLGFVLFPLFFHFCKNGGLPLYVLACFVDFFFPPVCGS